ncbi:hypothetical protein JW935_10650 [candidate division KSB1 bacterium]|nr:hypothetical protein [candidate division KSB1 bacterium]
MSKCYDAKYKAGKLEWLHEKPVIKDGDQVVVYIDNDKSAKKKNHLKKVLETAWGAWSMGQSMDDIDRKLEKKRNSDWNRNEDHSR